MRKLVLVDGNSLLHRAYHAYPPLNTVNGELVNAVYGFSSMFLNLFGKLSPTHVAVAWDVKGGSFRKKVYKEYKANRGPMDDNLAIQIDRTKEVVGALGVPQYGIEGFEGDDIIGTLARVATDEKEEDDNQVVIVTADRDELQLIKEKRVVVYLPLNNRSMNAVVFDENRVVEEYGVRPMQIVELKGLMGDPSDNIPGVKGVGKVTATNLIKEFGTVEGVYKNIESKTIKPRLKEMLIRDKEMAFLSVELATIKRDIELSFDWKDCQLETYDKQKAIELFRELDFLSLIDKLPKNEWEKEAEEVFL